MFTSLRDICLDSVVGGESAQVVGCIRAKGLCVLTSGSSGRLFYAPIDAPKKIIDLGTGTGIWAVEGLYTRTAQ
jgi:ribosomal protein L11 methylase PrmA